MPRKKSSKGEGSSCSSSNTTSSTSSVGRKQNGNNDKDAQTSLHDESTTKKESQEVTADSVQSTSSPPRVQSFSNITSSSSPTHPVLTRSPSSSSLRGAGSTICPTTSTSAESVAKIAALTRYISLPAIRDITTKRAGSMVQLRPHPIAQAFQQAVAKTFNSEESANSTSGLPSRPISPRPSEGQDGEEDETARWSRLAKMGGGGSMIGGHSHGHSHGHRRVPSTSIGIEDIPLEERSRDELIEEILCLSKDLEEKEQDVQLAAEIGRELLESNERLNEQLTELFQVYNDEKDAKNSILQTNLELQKLSDEYSHQSLMSATQLKVAQKTNKQLLRELERFKEDLDEKSEIIRELNPLRTMCRQLQTQIGVLESTKAEAEQQMIAREADLTKTIAKLKNENESQKAELTKLFDDVEGLQTSLNAVAEEREKLRSLERHNRLLASEISQLKEENSLLNTLTHSRESSSSQAALLLQDNFFSNFSESNLRDDVSRAMMSLKDELDLQQAKEEASKAKTLLKHRQAMYMLMAVAAKKRCEAAESKVQSGLEIIANLQAELDRMKNQMQQDSSYRKLLEDANRSLESELERLQEALKETGDSSTTESLKKSLEESRTKLEEEKSRLAKAHKEEVENLKGHLKTLQSKVEHTGTLEKEVEGLKTRLEIMDVQLKAQMQKNSALSDLLREKEDLLSDTLSQRDEGLALKVQHLQEISQQQQKLGELSTELKEIKEAYSIISQERDTLKEDRTKNESDTRQLQSEYEEKLAKAQEALAETELKFREAITKYEGTIVELQSNLAKQSQENATIKLSLLASNNDLAKQLQEATSKLEAETTARQNLEEEFAAMQQQLLNQIDLAQKATEDERAARLELEERIRGLEALHLTAKLMLEDERKVNQEKLKLLENQLETLQKDRDSEASSLKSELETLRQLQESGEREKKSLREELENSQQQAQKQRLILESDKARLAEEVSELKKTIVGLNNDSTNIKKENERLRGELNVETSQTMRLKEENSKLRQELETLRALLAAKELQEQERLAALPAATVPTATITAPSEPTPTTNNLMSPPGSPASPSRPSLNSPAQAFANRSMRRISSLTFGPPRSPGSLIATPHQRDVMHYVNEVLGEDPLFQEVLPQARNLAAISDLAADGVLLCKLLSAAVPGTIDDRVLNLNPTTEVEVTQNINLFINSAKAVGCKVANLTTNDLLEMKEETVTTLLSEVLKVSVLSKVNFEHHPELVKMKSSNFDIQHLTKLPPEKLLLQWVNWHLEQAKSNRRIVNFGKDLSDSEVLILLLNRLDPAQCTTEALTEGNLEKRAEMVLTTSEKLAARKFITPNDIVTGNEKLNILFVGNLFHRYTGLAELSAEEKVATMESKVIDFEGNREELAFRMWLNSLNVQPYVNSLTEDLCDGLVILQMFDRIAPGIVEWQKVTKRVSNKYHKLENCNYAVSLGQKLSFSLVNVSGSDFVEGNLKLLLSLIWQARFFQIQSMLKKINAQAGVSKEMAEKFIINWANTKVSTVNPTLQIESFKDTQLRTSLFFIDLLRAVEPLAVDLQFVKQGINDEECQMNAKYVISAARKIGCCIFLSWQDILEVKPRMLMLLVATLLYTFPGK